jgi:hypothetical protein
MLRVWGREVCLCYSVRVFSAPTSARWRPWYVCVFPRGVPFSVLDQLSSVLYFPDVASLLHYANSERLSGDGVGGG